MEAANARTARGPSAAKTGRVWALAAVLAAYLVYAFGHWSYAVCLAVVPGPAHYAVAYAGMVGFGVLILVGAERFLQLRRQGPSRGADVAWLAVAAESVAVAYYIGTTIYPNSACPVWPFT